MLNHTINSNMNSLNTDRVNRKTAREFFSKDNLNHPSIEENKQLHQQLMHLKSVKKESSAYDTHSIGDMSEKTADVRRQLD